LYLKPHNTRCPCVIRRRTYIGFAPYNLCTKSTTNAGKKWKSDSQILWMRRLVRKVKPGYHRTYCVSISQACFCIEVPKYLQLTGFTDLEVQLYTWTVFVLNRKNLTEIIPFKFVLPM